MRVRMAGDLLRIQARLDWIRAEMRRLKEATQRLDDERAYLLGDLAIPDSFDAFRQPEHPGPWQVRDSVGPLDQGPAAAAAACAAAACAAACAAAWPEVGLDAAALAGAAVEAAAGWLRWAAAAGTWDVRLAVPLCGGLPIGPGGGGGCVPL